MSNYEGTVQQLWAMKILKKTSNFEGWGLILVAHKKIVNEEYSL